VFLRKTTKLRKKRASCLGVKKEHENFKVRAQKMMRGRVEPSIVPTMAHVAR
jgi:hypothetical protein